MVEVNYALCLVYSSLGDQSGFEEGSTRVIGLKKRLPDVEFDGAGIPAELMGNGVLIPAGQLQAEACEHSEGVG